MAFLPYRWCHAILRRWLLRYIVLIVLFGVFLGVTVIGMDQLQLLDNKLFATITTTTTEPSNIVLSPERMREAIENRRVNKEGTLKDTAELRLKWMKDRIQRMSQKVNNTKNIMLTSDEIPPYQDVHTFYYAWYGSLSYDGSWEHWNHEYIENWKKDDMKMYPKGRHSPPVDIGANFYPQLGCYSSHDPKVIETHMQQIRMSGIGVLVVSWYPPGLSDVQNGTKSPDSIFRTLLNAAGSYGLKVAPHVEPYKGRNPINFLTHLQYFIKEYSSHPALYKTERNGKYLPVFYIYDSYLTPAVAWRELLGAKGNLSIRGTIYDAVFLGLLVEMGHKHEIKRAHFDGFYTYFGSNGFSYGSTWKNWKLLSKFATENKLLFVPSVGPGYIDTRVRPWNSGNTRYRRHGSYYGVGWRSAIAAKVPFVSITSFNEWHEGTQIEPAVPFANNDFTYLDYEPEGPLFYLNLTRWWVREFANSRKTQGAVSI